MDRDEDRILQCLPRGLYIKSMTLCIEWFIISVAGNKVLSLLMIWHIYNHIILAISNFYGFHTYIRPWSPKIVINTTKVHIKVLTQLLKSHQPSSSPEIKLGFRQLPWSKWNQQEMPTNNSHSIDSQHYNECSDIAFPTGNRTCSSLTNLHPPLKWTSSSCHSCFTI